MSKEVKALDFHMKPERNCQRVEDASQTFVYQFSALRGRQAGREYYAAMVPFGLVPKLLVFDDEELKRCFRHQLLLPSPYLVLTKPLRLDIQCQRATSVKISWKYLDD